jgi:hypothetical protein
MKLTIILNITVHFYKIIYFLKILNIFSKTLSFVLFAEFLFIFACWKILFELLGLPIV